MPYYIQPQDVTKLSAWQALTEHYQLMKKFDMRQAFSENTNRFKEFSLEGCELLFDYSKNLITKETIQLLVKLANDVGLTQARADLFSGKFVNASENRAALHTALRRPYGDQVFINDVDIMPEVHQVLHQMTELVNSIHNKLWRGFTEKPITDVVNIGIGGSFLGPMLVSEGLLPFAQKGVTCHYLANIDGSEFREVVAELNAETTLFIVSSKSFGTLETLKNAQAARHWFFAQGGTEKDLARHFIAVSSNVKAAVEFGIAKENIFPMWDWVGGRYSLWSAIGLPIALSVGMSNFKELLAGAYMMDQHFLTAPFEKNMPVLMALLGVWYSNFFNAQSHAILPYDHNLRDFVRHLQQLDMESNGKGVRQDGSPLTIDSGPIIWGGVGCNGQHAYHQLLHQGTRFISVDFIVPVVSANPVNNHHQWLYANCLSQSQALMLGKNKQQVEQELTAKGYSAEQIEKLAPHKVIAGNRPSNTLVLERVSPRSLGALVALYEHKVFVQSVIWGINAFDQWGVELGKELGLAVYKGLTDYQPTPAEDTSTQGLINYFRNHHRG
ncbi:glucose-6-phosphate isomerase [Entomomonas asaccharolytica]|uniref:Glucose-6-phosphate isomerase n=1 Tax=Entomomonas asaccharolytica TaxID=2785331 RepID=A0A974NIN5_9GAMM|nr:glucose-6-phosphate isomerase [Entomomonas asaccharolytica]QQP87204.1 glucose-6-phosphate isomerase [Entomomonas asaccharolytica]